MFEESQKIAEQKIRERQIELEEFELAAIKSEEGIDLSLDEFDEPDEETPLKFEKRKAGKADLDTEDFGEMECPFCAEIFSDLRTHINECDMAPDDVSIDDIIPQKKKKKKKPTKQSLDGEKSATEKQKCPYCGKEFQRLGRHLNSCPKKPAEKDEE
ncbi:MAG: hypothetical protein KGD65_13200 [Candidatus Lokiarchaeota archaeon]|nr:hypothetical protein [Candidatus Lokiarchaeota archaeon]